jgi:matrix metalloproteinase-20 (enamelysin)
MISSMNKQASDEQLTVQRFDMPKKFHGNSRVKDMTYAFSGFAESCILSRDDIKSAVASAFQSWVVVIQLDLWETNDFEATKIKIEFIVGDHSDKWPFDDPLPTVAHADRRIQLDSDKVWMVDMAVTDDKSAMDLESVALHEIGHLIGLDHSKVPCSVMFSHLKPRKVKRRLTCDDIEGAMALYHPRMSEFKHNHIAQ